MTALPRSVILSFLFLWLIVPKASAQEVIVINQWLVLGPIGVSSPAFSEEDFDAESFLDLGPETETEWWPRAGERFDWTRGQSATWQSRSGEVSLQAGGGNTTGVAWAAAYIEVDRWHEGRLVVETRQPVRAYLNGQALATKTSAESIDVDPGHISEEIELTPGKHVLLLKTVRSQDAAPWSLSARLESMEPEGSGTIRISVEPDRLIRMQDITDAPTPTSVSVSPSGDLVAVTITKRTGPDGDTDSRIEIRRTTDASLVRTYGGGMDVGSIEWVPNGRRFSYVDRSNDQADLWLVDIEKGSQERLLTGVENLGSHRWAPDGSFIVYSVTQEAEANETGVRRMEYLESRRPGFADLSQLYRLNLPQRTTQRLTAGDLSTSLQDISPDSRRILVSRSHIRYDERPFGVSEYSLIDLETLALDSIFTLPFAGNAQFSPDGRRILITGGPSAFGASGIAVPDGTVPNDYDTQAYLYDLEGGDVTAITRDFDPSVSQVMWSETDNAIFLTTTDASYGRLYRYYLSAQRFEQIPTQGDVISRLSVADRLPVAAYVSSGISSPPRAWLIDLADGRSRELADPAGEVYQNIRFGDVRDWSFTNDRGEEIDGHVYLPPDFDESQTYPVIVYYYGGTTPVTRDFAGRYPKELWAANGYLVYVLQPSGAVGYGQEFSALHVNDWGEIVADEIIDGVQQFLAVHAYADANRVGAIGASFGGFMTMLLQTRTDMFAAAVSHAGISNIASYWGEGFWGFQYSAVATADSYPWNRRDVYVDRSPLYAADRITTPLLLLHGASDTNVPPGESLQMFTALKLLGREVEYVEIADQDHHILDYGKRIIWTNAILAWFDRWLKDQPEWWEAMF